MAAPPDDRPPGERSGANARPPVGPAGRACEPAPPLAAGTGQFDAMTADTERPATGPTWLVCLAGPSVGKTFALTTAVTTLGRDSTASVLLPQSEVSRLHARIVRDGGTYVLEDLASANGTFVNGDRTSRRPLRAGDRIQLGRGVLLLFVAQETFAAQATRLQRLDGFSTYAGHVVHDFRNKIGLVCANLEYVAERAAAIAPGDADVSEALIDAKAAARATVALLTRLQRLARRDRPAPTLTPLDAVVTRALGLVQRSLDRRIQLRLDIAPAARALSDPDELTDAVVEVCTNAREAMPDGGTLALRGDTVELDRGQADAFGLPGEGLYASLSVTDTGRGILPEHQPRIFEPLFTTKPAGHGTGMALATIHLTARSLGGTVTFESRPGVGTTFCILLPGARGV